MELSFGDMEVSFPFVQNIQLGDMMAKRIIWCLIAVTLVMALHGREGKAEENICISPTTTSGVTIPPDWHGDLAIYAEKWTISRDEGVSLWCVCGEGPLCPNYQWSVSGNGFHFDSSAGPTTGETQKQFEIIELWADNTACGTATVTVTDDCVVTNTAYILCSSGAWVLKDNYSSTPTRRGRTPCPTSGTYRCNMGVSPGFGGPVWEQSGYRKWEVGVYNNTCYGAGGAGSDCCTDYTQPVIDWEPSSYPYPPCGGPDDCCMTYYSEFQLGELCNYSLAKMGIEVNYYEWECP
jgi:hypothetical protein